MSNLVHLRLSDGFSLFGRVIYYLEKLKRFVGLYLPFGVKRLTGNADFRP